MPVYSVVKTGVEYSTSVDYRKINKQEIESKAQEYFLKAKRLKDGCINEDMTNALTLYAVLQQSNLAQIDYPIKLGILYDKINRDKLAKSNLFRAINLDKTNPLPYFHFGDFYYKRESYVHALKYYNEAYRLGMNSNYDLLYKMGDIYEKFGDTSSALKYFQEARLQDLNPDVDSKFRRVELQSANNEKFYSNTRIRG